MIKKIVFFVFLFSSSIISKIHADEYINTMYQGCVSWNNYNKGKIDINSISEGEFTKLMICKSYILGWLSAGRMDNILILNKSRGSKESSVGCYKDNKINNLGSRAKVTSRLFVKFLDKNPKYFDLTMEDIMWDMHNEAYKC
tara:strand:- start:91 stop:516 length:426 start_codon:yes stop_codon:yes gene_type:complete